MNKRQQLGARSRATILDAALQLMADSGYEGASVAKIAKSSGLPASSIYWHFGSKAGVLAAVMERGADAFFETAAENPADLPDDGSPLEVLRSQFQQARRAAEAHPEFLRLLFLLLLADPADEAVVAIVRRVNDRGREVLHTQVAEAFAAKGPEAATEIADRVSVAAFVVFNGAFITVQNNPDLSLEHLIDVMAETTVLLATHAA